MTPLKHESITVSLPSTDQIHLTRFFLNKKNLGPPVFMLHSIAADSSTFFSADGKGLASYLARAGFDVFVADLRGRGKSWPKIGAAARFGLTETITEDIPALLGKIVARRGQVPQIWIGHGWGSVLLMSYYARFGTEISPVEKMLHFGSRRQLVATNRSKVFRFDWQWRKLGHFLVRLKGFLPGSAMYLGRVNESACFYRDYLRWSDNEEWVGLDDFDYGAAIKQQMVPPSYYIASLGDQVYGDLDDVRHFIKALGSHDGRLLVLSRDSGNSRNYDHLELLQHSDCENDHFPIVAEWLASPVD